MQQQNKFFFKKRANIDSYLAKYY